MKINKDEDEGEDKDEEDKDEKDDDEDDNHDHDVHDVHDVHDGDHDCSRRIQVKKPSLHITQASDTIQARRKVTHFCCLGLLSLAFL